MTVCILIVCAGRKGIGCPVFEESRTRLESFRSVKTSQLLKAGFCKGGFPKRRAPMGTHAQETEQGGAARERCRIVNFTERTDEALRCAR